MKKLALIIVVLTSMVSFSQKMMTRSGEIKFDATVGSSVDEVKATSNTVSCIFDKTTGDIAVQAMVKSFKFKSPLMEEHFNENYMESDKLPKATFKGKVLDFTGKSGTYDVEGDLTIHGVTQKVKTKMTVTVTSSKVTLSGGFTVKLKDYKIDVPALAKKTLAETAKLVINLELDPKP